MFKKKEPVETGHERLIIALSSKYREALRRYFLRRVGDAQEADDLTQEVFVRIIRKSDMEAVENPEGFLFRAALNLLRDRSRQARTANAFIAEITSHMGDNFEVLSPERVLDSKQVLRTVLKALDNLDPRMRNVFILYRLEGLKQTEIAAMYGISLSSVEKYIVKCQSYLSSHANRPEGTK